MIRVLKLCSILAPTYLVINKWDLNPEKSAELEKIGQSMSCKLLDKIQFSPLFPKAQKQTILEYAPDNLAAKEVQAIWSNLCRKITC